MHINDAIETSSSRIWAFCTGDASDLMDAHMHRTMFEGEVVAETCILNTKPFVESIDLYYPCLKGKNTLRYQGVDVIEGARKDDEEQTCGWG